MLIHAEGTRQRPGKRALLGELCHRTGLLRLLQGIRGRLRQDVRILAYHRVLTLSEEQSFDFDLGLVSASAEGFRQQMLLLKKRFRPMRLGDIADAIEAGRRLPANAVVVTFDDGYDDNYQVAYPILRELGIPATFFVSTGHIDSGRPYDYDWLVHMIMRSRVERIAIPELGLDMVMPGPRAGRRELAFGTLRQIKTLDATAQSKLLAHLEQAWEMPRAAPHPDCRPMTWPQLREMHAAGYEIGSHGVHHRMLAKLSDEDLAFELRESKATIERELGGSATLIAYPVGGRTAFDRRVIEATIAAGYRAGCSYIQGTNPVLVPEPYELHRLPVEHIMGLGWFAAMLTLPEWMGYATPSRTKGIP